MNQHCNKLRDEKRYEELMRTEWVRLTLISTGTLNGIFLAACRHLIKILPQQQQIYTKLAIEYKLHCVRALRQAIADDSLKMISDSSFANVILLAYDEVSLRSRAMALNWFSDRLSTKAAAG